jgi:hypothetical protein
VVLLLRPCLTQASGWGRCRGAERVAYLEAAGTAWGPSASRWGHWAPQVLIGAIVASILLVLRPLPASPAFLLAPFLIVAVVLGSWIAMRQHDRMLCERCMSAMPLNPSEVAARCRLRFAVTHMGSDRRALAAYLLVLVMSNLLLMAPAGIARTIGEYAWAAVQTTLIYLVLCHCTHRRLQPWCPECEGGGPGDDERVSDPTPSGSFHR